jgi:hypothetical protein
MIQYGDRVRVIDSTYCCAQLGAQGVIVNNPEPQKDGSIRYLVRWDYSPTTLFGVHNNCIEGITT